MQVPLSNLQRRSRSFHLLISQQTIRSVKFIKVRCSQANSSLRSVYRYVLVYLGLAQSMFCRSIQINPASKIRTRPCMRIRLKVRLAPSQFSTIWKLSSDKPWRAELSSMAPSAIDTQDHGGCDATSLSFPNLTVLIMAYMTLIQANDLPPALFLSPV